LAVAVRGLVAGDLLEEIRPRVFLIDPGEDIIQWEAIVAEERLDAWGGPPGLVLGLTGDLGR
jgi:hypothetical protein